MSPKKKAEQARKEASKTYRRDAGHYLQRGILWQDVDMEAARDLWLTGMHALDCAIKAEEGMLT